MGFSWTVWCLLGIWACAVAFPETAKRNDVPPYRELAREIADEYLARRAENDAATERDDERRGRTSNNAHHNFNRPTQQAREMTVAAQRRMIENDVLRLLAGNDEQVLLRELSLDAREILPEGFDYCTVENSITCVTTSEFRTINGTCNNLANKRWGMTYATQKRRLTNRYDDGKWKLREKSAAKRANKLKIVLPHARKVSNAVHNAATDEVFDEGISFMVAAWGQFMAHDWCATPEGELRNGFDQADCCDPTIPKNDKDRFCMNITLPEADSDYPEGHCMDALRSAFVSDCTEPTLLTQFNQITSLTDASMIYGSDYDESLLLRKGVRGEMLISNEKFPPADPDVCEGIGQPFCSKCGDGRCNASPQLHTIHVLFLREHNRIAKNLAELNADWDDEQIYQTTRKIIGAIIQKITYGDWIPKLLNEDTRIKFNLKLLDTTHSSSYDANVDPTISLDFCIALRVGHTMQPKFIRRFTQESNNQYNTTEGVLEDRLHETLFNPFILYASNYKGIDGMARFMGGSHCPFMQGQVPDDLRNHLFGDHDLPATNIQRSRDWGLNGYIEVRRWLVESGHLDSAYNFTTPTVTFQQLNTTHNASVIAKLQAVYNVTEDIDLFVGCVLENHLPGARVGPVLSALLGLQLKELKVGDRFWFENDIANIKFTSAQLAAIRGVTLSQIMCANIEDLGRVPEDAFAPGDPSGLLSCGNDKLIRIDLGPWQEE